jgi:hypothetical protein
MLMMLLSVWVQPINIGGVAIPSSARLNLFQTNGQYQPLEWITLANVTSGAGMMFMHTLAVTSQNLNFLEACYHMYTANQVTGVAAAVSLVVAIAVSMTLLLLLCR